MVYGYIRVSTDNQDCENQKLGIENKARALGLKVEKYIYDTPKHFKGCIFVFRQGGFFVGE